MIKIKTVVQLLMQASEHLLSRKKGSVRIYSTYKISILGCPLINYVTSMFLLNGFVASVLHSSQPASQLQVNTYNYIIMCLYACMLIAFTIKQYNNDDWVAYSCTALLPSISYHLHMYFTTPLCLQLATTGTNTQTVESYWKRCNQVKISMVH